MLVALLVIWVGFHIWSGGTFLTPRNLWNLSVQTAAVAIMATGMVLVIVSRNIDLSVGSMLAVIGMAMALLQAEILPDLARLRSLGDLDHRPGGRHRSRCRHRRVSGRDRRLRRRAVVHRDPRRSARLARCGLGDGQRADHRPDGLHFPAPRRRFSRQHRRDLELDHRPRRRLWHRRGCWSTAGDSAASSVSAASAVGGGLLGVIGCRRRPRRRLATSTATSCRSGWPANAEERGIAWPEGGVDIPLGLANPVLIAIVVALVMTFIATRRRVRPLRLRHRRQPRGGRAGRHQDPVDHREDVRADGRSWWPSRAAVQIARLNAAVSGLGQLSELYVIAAAVIGGTSLAGGIGTIPGAVLGALVMQSLQSGMVLDRRRRTAAGHRGRRRPRGCRGHRLLLSDGGRRSNDADY